MNRPRITPNGLPDRVRERIGKRVYRIYLDPFNGPDVDLYREPVGKHTKREARMIAIQRYGEMFKVADKSQEVMIAFLYDKYRAWQLSLPLGNTDRKAEATLETDRTHIKPVLADFGHMHPDNIEPKYWMLWRDKINRPGFNQMMALVSTVIEFGRLRGYCQTNTAKGIPKIKAVRIARRLTLAQIDECMPVAVNRGKQAVIQLLCARTAFLCAKRPSEILRLRKADLKDKGIEFTASKRKASQSVNKVLVEWSDELRLTVQSALAQASKSRICPWVFPTDEGKQYSRSGWGSSWARLMNDCEAQMLGFQRFTLRNGRAGGVTTKEARGDQDTQTLTQHSDKRMIQKIYDENTTKKATPAG